MLRGKGDGANQNKGKEEQRYDPAQAVAARQADSKEECRHVAGRILELSDHTQLRQSAALQFGLADEARGYRQQARVLCEIQYRRCQGKDHGDPGQPP